MWASDITDKGYEVGTFKIGQTAHHIKDITHVFRFHRECTYCDSKGIILIKGKEFKCPNCNGATDRKEVTEKVIGEPEKVKSVLSFKNRNKELEIYTSDNSGYGVIICKQDDGNNRWFGSREEAQVECDKYNAIHGVYRQLEDYANRKNRVLD